MSPPSWGATGSAPRSTSIVAPFSAAGSRLVRPPPPCYHPASGHLPRSPRPRRCRCCLDSPFRAGTTLPQTHSVHAGPAAATRFVQPRVA